MATLVSPSISLRPSLTPRIARGRAAAAVRAASGDDANLDTVYVGKGKFVKDDARKYPSRDALTGGWAGGEVGMWAFRDKEQKGNAAQSMRPARDVASAVGLSNGGSTPVVSSEPNDDASSSASSRGDRDAASASTSNVDKIKYELMKTLATLDRGVAASEDDRSAVNALVESLETLASSPSRAASLAPTNARLEAALDGAWRLAYSSTFAGEQTGSQGFTGAPGGGSPGASRGSVYQRVSRGGVVGALVRGDREHVPDHVHRRDRGEEPVRSAAVHAAVADGRAAERGARRADERRVSERRV
jgi:hypothetical protein